MTIARATLPEIRMGRLDALSERAEFDAGRPALSVGDEIRVARTIAGLGQRDLPALARTNRATVARLEAGDLGKTLATVQRVAVASGFTLRVELSTD